MLPSLDTLQILNAAPMIPVAIGGVQYIHDFSVYAHNLSELNFAGDDSEFETTGQSLLLTAVKQLSGGADVHFDFTFQDFSIEARIHPTASGVARFLAQKCLAATDGWAFYLSAANRLTFETYQAAATQTTDSTAIALADGGPHQYAVSRSGGGVKLFYDGREVTYNAVGIHINPVAPTSRNLLVFGFAGYAHQIKVWTRAVGASEWRERFFGSIYG